MGGREVIYTEINIAHIWRYAPRADGTAPKGVPSGLGSSRTRTNTTVFNTTVKILGDSTAGREEKRLLVDGDRRRRRIMRVYQRKGWLYRHEGVSEQD